MSISTDAILAYGFDLGGEDAGWKVEGLDEYGDLPIGADYEDLWQAMIERLAAAHGMTVIPDGYIDETELKRRSGVKFVVYQHAVVPAYILATDEIRVRRGESRRIENLNVRTPDADEKLRAAIAVIGITPQGEPGWYLVPYTDF